MKVPGVSLTLGMSQETQTPYARVTGRHGMFSMGKRLSLDDNKGLIALVAGVLIANAVRKSKTGSKAKAKVRKIKDVTPKPEEALGSFLGNFFKQ